MMASGLPAMADDALNGNTRPWIVAVCNQKGGVGKTTTALNLASVFADGSGRVQVVDPDLAGMGSGTVTGRPVDRGSGSGHWVQRTAVAGRRRVLISCGRRGGCSG